MSTEREVRDGTFLSLGRIEAMPPSSADSGVGNRISSQNVSWPILTTGVDALATRTFHFRGLGPRQGPPRAGRAVEIC